MSRFAVILPAAGRGTRFHDKSYSKPFAPLAGKALWLHSAERFLRCYASSEQFCFGQHI